MKLTLENLLQILPEPTTEHIRKYFPNYKTYQQEPMWNESEFNQFWKYNFYEMKVYHTLNKNKVYDDNWINPNRKKIK